MPGCCYMNGMTTENVDVIILGAGVAGLTAAKTLSENNVTDFVILEGSDRIGGRIKHGFIGSTTVELGSNYIVGTTGNPVWDLASGYNLSGVVTNYDNVTVLDAFGTDVTNTEAAAAWVKWKSAIGVLGKKYSDIRANKIEDIAVGVGLKLGGWYPDSPVKRAIQWYESVDFSFAQITNLVSLKERNKFLQRLIIDGSNSEFLVSDPRGYVHVFNEMKNDFLVKDDVRLKLNEVVTVVKYDDSKVVVTTSANKTYTANYAIMTFGLGVLQHRLVKFEPELPLWKEDNLFRINVGHAANVLVECSEEARAFFNKKAYAVYASENYGFHPVWVNMMADGLLPNTSNIISSMPTGEEAQRVERIGESALKSEITKLLRDVNKNQNIPEPTTVLVSDWSRNPLFMGSMASLPSGFSEDRIQAVKAPVGRLYFAGEAYHVMFRGFVRGAYYSGRNQARLIVKCRQGLCTKYEPPEGQENECSSSQSVRIYIPSVFILALCTIASHIYI
ncbi:polyamine oxidase 1-like [Gigantopelta aegis]|uniref:polyamine oxidase 1-like n=1 Tax=Gigantopelta aegis TaxID=1735272 RepID=UPI001B88C5C8|nr:polyamine oxidase 1-like [Gigantopelta aegis]